MLVNTKLCFVIFVFQATVLYCTSTVSEDFLCSCGCRWRLSCFKVLALFRGHFILFCLQLVREGDTQLSWPPLYPHIIASYILPHNFNVWVYRITAPCVHARAALCSCVNPEWKATFFFWNRKAEGGRTPWWASVCGPVSLCEWVWIRRLPTRTHGWLSWQSEAHWPVTEIKRRAISAT